MIDVDKYNGLVNQYDAMLQSIRAELGDCGFISLVQKSFESGDFAELEIQLKKMEWSYFIGYVERRIKTERKKKQQGTTCSGI